MKKVIHLIPFDGIGGVESAANTMKDIHSDGIDFALMYIFKKQSKKWNYLSSLSLIRILFCIYKLFLNKPDLIIVSLWRSCIPAIVFKLISPKTKVILFLHYPHHYHFIDMLLTKFMAMICQGIWADSQDTLNSRLPHFAKNKSDVISLVARKLNSLDHDDVSPNFIFWGRLHEQKCIDRAIDIFAQIQLVYKKATYTIIGPDGGELSKLKKQVHSKGIVDNVNFTGAKDIQSIINLSRNSSFYLQTSNLEGMAMSVVEAMQLGLVPIVTPVGEIKNYCDSKNSILIYENQAAISNIFNLIENNNQYNNLKKNAINRWKDHEIYSDSFLKASKRILNLSN